jgi:hypothetical protein
MVAPNQPSITPKQKSETTRVLSPRKLEHGAQVVKEASAMGVLSILAQKIFKKQIPPACYQQYRNHILADSGAPSDPLEMMMLEQQIWAHFRIADLHVEAAVATSPELIELYTAAGAKLMGEFRRTCLAIREYRSPVVAKHITLVKQQNVAAGDQQVALIASPSPHASQRHEAAIPEVQPHLEDLRHEQSHLIAGKAPTEALEAIESRCESREQDSAPVGHRHLCPPERG